MRQTVWALAFLLVATAAGGTAMAGGDPPDPPPRTTSAVREPSAGASQRKRIFIGVVGLAALLFGATGLWLMRRDRTPPSPSSEPVSPPSAETSATPGSEPAPSAKPPQAAMLCPTCRAEYPLDARFCKQDGNRLVAVREGTDHRGPTGGICPVCGQGYDPGVPLCPVHHEELVPAQVYNAGQRTSGSYPKICPTCGVHYPSGSGFCGADGSALETVN